MFINSKDFSKRIRILRIKKGWSQQKLADKIVTSQATICRMEIDCAKIRWIYVLRTLSYLSNHKFVIETALILSEGEMNVFLEYLKKNDKAWSLINYNPKKAAQICIEAINKKFK